VDDVVERVEALRACDPDEGLAVRRNGHKNQK